jgi:uncharacterized protein YeaO (DUF488 family)
VNIGRSLSVANGRRVSSEEPVLRIKRAYAPADRADGYRVLVDRLWPRGVSRERLRIDIWLKEAAPSAELRRWFAHDARKWPAFKRRYFRELDAKSETLEPIRALLSRTSVTLVHAAKKPFNNAVALKVYLERRDGRRVGSRSGDRGTRRARLH